MTFMHDIKNMLFELGVKPSKKLSQNFLLDKDIIAREIEFANIGSGDVVLDIGAGLGILTEELSKKARSVIAIELDKHLAAYLEKRFAGNEKVKVLNGDVLDLLENLEFDKVVANIPYKISSPLTFALLSKKCMQLAVICYQKEFAERMVAKPGTKSYSRLSVMTDYLADAELLAGVGRKSFFPPPDISSSIVRMAPKRKKPYSVRNEKKFFETVTLLFQHKKQTVRNALAHSSKRLGLPKNAVKELKLPQNLESRRVFTLTGAEIATISEMVETFAQGD
ncbi:MAG: 16S rRNA (adenine(1518)-N(6)/adenine(1519)-N(6))-dimethyltransferase RsmA [Candidatus Aenigmatarchaeota archaeon]